MGGGWTRQEEDTTIEITLMGIAPVSPFSNTNPTDWLIKAEILADMDSCPQYILLFSLPYDIPHHSSGVYSESWKLDTVQKSMH